MKNQGNTNGVIHGEHGTSLYMKWKSMRGRVSSHPHYIEKGIGCCAEWDDYLAFKMWSEQNGYNNDLSLDRANTHQGYSPANCRWVSKTIQAENSCIRKDNKSGYRGVHLEKSTGKYKVQIQVEKKKVYLGKYVSIVEAALAYNNYVISIGTQHTLNVIE